jgi:hypothetical protein
MRTYLHDAKHQSPSLFALVMTILPEAKMSGVVLVINPDDDYGETLCIWKKGSTRARDEPY